MAEARKIGDNLSYGKTGIDNILKALLTDGNNISEYEVGKTYNMNDVVYIINGSKIDIFRAVNDKFTETSFTESNWTKINIQNFSFGNPPVISDTEPTDTQTKIWIQPI